ncbi:DUF1367 family protein [Aquimarina algiphila]|uniref:DUF1367 family protein n=1 Tax=Aquimarina algiphila TaxID=2047982 RepID=A0A554VAP8_9FLAO|nr:DUF1367 family protein [Aquimarina algiphila]TSE03351.1 DUF1367 family protein [Aquimarina algiphila]
MKLFLVKQLNNTLKVVYNSDHDKIKKLKLGEMYQCEVKRPRNIGFHRKFFALVNMVFDNQEIYVNLDRLRKDLTIEAGFYDEWVDFQGVIQREAKSISFAKMKESDFQDMYSKVIDVIVQYFHFDRQDIIDNVEQYF